MEGGKGARRKSNSWPLRYTHSLRLFPSLSLSLSVLFSRMGYHSIQNGAESFKPGSARMN